jgi:hypothetical protein
MVFILGEFIRDCPFFLDSPDSAQIHKGREDTKKREEGIVVRNLVSRHYRHSGYNEVK